MFPAVLALAGLGFLAVMAGIKRRAAGEVISYDPEAERQVAYVATTTKGKSLSPVVVALAEKWAKKRGVPAREIVATIIVESGGRAGAKSDNPTKEDSRGLMQVNINTWKPLLVQNGMTVEDLYDPEKNIMIGSYIYAQYRKNVQALITQSGVKQSAPLDVLTRLYYKGPKYVKDNILAGEDASYPYKDAEKAINNWQIAMNTAAAVTSD